MTNAEPLILVLTVLALLWFFGWWLNKIQSLPNNNRYSNPRGEEITPYLHVLGLNESQRNELKAIINDGEQATLAKFIAYYRPGFDELDKYIGTLRKRYLEILDKPIAKATEIQKIAAICRIALDGQPQPFNFGMLSKDELRSLYEYNPQIDRRLNKEFIKKFGDIQFMENFNVYKQLISEKSGSTLYVSKTDSCRLLLEMLANNGVVLRGRRIELNDRLRVLKLEQLNNMAKELKIRKTFQSIEIAVQTLAQVPGSAILLAMIYSIDDLFFLDPNAIDVKSIELELSICSCYAKLIFSAIRQPTPNILLRQSL